MLRSGQPVRGGRTDHRPRFAGRSRPTSLIDALESAAAQEAPYLVFHGAGGREELPARRALEAARCWAMALSERGVGRGDRVPILLPTGPSFIGAFLGALYLGAIPTPLASPLTFGRLDRYVDNLSRIVVDAGATTICTTPRFARAMAEVESTRRQLRSVLMPSDVPDATTRAPIPPSIDGSDPGLLQYTSGSTGDPKGVLVSHRALVSNASAIADGLDLTDADVGVCWLPLFHDMGLIGSVVLPLCHPFEVHVLSPEAFIMRPRRWLELISQVGATVSAAPNFAYELCTARAKDLGGISLESWRAALNGAEAVHASTLSRFADRFADVGFAPQASLPVYGLAENTLAVSFSDRQTEPRVASVDGDALSRGVFEAGSDRHLVSVGRPVAGARLRITDDAGAPVAPGRVGEIRVSGPSLMDGYFGKPEATSAAIVDGWLRTGDLGLISDGELYIVGREKDIIVLGGRNLHPDEVERVAREVEGVRGGAVAFAEVDDVHGTETFVVAVEVAEPDPDGRARIARAVRGELLATLGLGPSRVETVALGALPRTTSGKIQRSAVRARGGFS